MFFTNCTFLLLIIFTLSNNNIKGKAFNIKTGQGHKVIFALPKRKWGLINKTPVRVIDIPPYVLTDSISVFKAIKDKSLLRDAIKAESKIIEKYSPDVIVNDFRLSAILTSANYKLPTFYITGGAGVPYDSYIPNPGLPKLIHKLALPLTQHFIWKIKKKFLSSLVEISHETGNNYSLKQLISRMSYIIPESKDYLPSVNKSLSTVHTGPIIWDGFSYQNPTWFKTLQRQRKKVVYISFGGTGFDKTKLIQLSKKLAQIGYQVIVSCGSIAKISEFPKNKNLFVTNYLDGFTACKKSDVVICHGGYGTMIQAIISGKPVISIPFNPDQIVHSLRFQELGLGKIIFKPNLEFYKNLINGNWQGFEQQAKNVGIESIISALEEIYNNIDKYKKNVSKYEKKINYQESTKKAVANILKALPLIFINLAC